MESYILELWDDYKYLCEKHTYYCSIGSVNGFIAYQYMSEVIELLSAVKG